MRDRSIDGIRAFVLALLCAAFMATAPRAAAQSAGGPAADELASQRSDDVSLAESRRAAAVRAANAGTVGLISGGVEGTYIRIAADLAAVLDGEELRILPLVGKGSVQNTLDIMYLRGIDIGIVQSDVLAYLKRGRSARGVERAIQYITKLYNEEFHVLGGREAMSLEDLAGKKVNVDVEGSGTFITATQIFEDLGIPIEPTHFDQALALEKVKSGEIAAMAYVVGKPARLFGGLSGVDGLHFIAVPATEKLLQTYLPTTLGHGDYPRLLPEGETLETVAVGAVMAVYAWPRATDRHRKVARFVEAFFSRFPEFLKPPRHAKWREVNLAAQLPGWTRFSAAEDWLTAAAAAERDSERRQFDRFLEETAPEAANLPEQRREALFAQFLEWRRTAGVHAGAEAAPRTSAAGEPGR